MTEQAPPEAIEAALALVREMFADSERDLAHKRALTLDQIEARRIAALLPKPVDPAEEVVDRLLRETTGIGEREDLVKATLFVGSLSVFGRRCYDAGAAATKGRGA